MFLTRLDLSGFRHFEAFQFTPQPGCNFIFGPNGSGKSSVLEAIYVLAMGRSFRSAQLNPLIGHHAAQFQVVGQWQNAFGRCFTVGFGRKPGVSDVRVNGQAIGALSELVRLVPVQLINHDSFHLLDAGPQCRREFLDWGVFHSEPTFYPAWQRYQRALKQRNAGLKRRLPRMELSLWEQELSLQAETIHRLRAGYVQRFMPYFDKVLANLLNLEHFTIQYQAGWDVNSSLVDVLSRHYERDSQLGHSQHGPHRADLKLRLKNLDADQVLSRGQQKLVSYALRLAQSELLQGDLGKSTVFLIDDLAAELDGEKISQALQLLFDLQCQLFITGVDASLVMQACQKLNFTEFHVEQLLPASSFG